MKLIKFAIFFVGFACFFSLCHIQASPEDFIVKRVQAHLVIKDYDSACQEAQKGLMRYPHSKLLAHAYLKALAKSGNEKIMFQHWNQYFKNSDECESRELLEMMAWAIIEHGSNSSSPMIRVISMLGGFLSQDSKGIAILLKNLGDGNSLVRSVAIQLSSEYVDAPLKEEVLRIFREENKWNVRLEAIKAIGKMKIEEANTDLITLISQNHASAEEKIIAISSMVALSDQMDRKHIQNLVQSPYSGLRLLASELIAYNEQIEDVDLLLPLLRDVNAEVRANTLKTIGLLRVSCIAGYPVNRIVENFISDHNPNVAISAAWVLTINSSIKGLETFRRLLENETQDVRLTAAAALRSTGRYGYTLIREQFKNHPDLYVRMNLALGLLSQHSDIKPACDCLYSGLLRENEKWMWTEKGFFEALVPSEMKYDAVIPNYPEALNQLARLQVLNMLAIMQYPYAQQAIKEFLQQKNWGISGVASALLLTEGDEAAVDLVEELLDDPDQHVKVQAALILALWGQGENAVNLLQSAYFQVSRELKERILEGMANIKAPSTIPFLVERLQEPSQSLRMIAATALLACLNK